jgi:hypothetical protein
MASQTEIRHGSSHFIDRTLLIKLKSKAMRTGAWFRALPRIDRVLVDLTIKVAETVRSAHLAKSIFAVVSKLEGLLESSILQSMRIVGFQLAEKISLMAQRWGNPAARRWANDSSFAFFLVVMQKNG